MASKFRENLNVWGTIIFGCLLAFGALKTAYDKFIKEPEQSVQTPARAAQEIAVAKPAPAPDQHPEDETALKLLKHPQIWGSVCEQLKDAKVVDRFRGTASANNHPAYIVGYDFVCVDSVAGNKQRIHYVGWMENTDTKTAECIHHNADKQRVLGEGWHTCGGNLKLQ